MAPEVTHYLTFYYVTHKAFCKHLGKLADASFFIAASTIHSHEDLVDKLNTQGNWYNCSCNSKAVVD